ncbi:hypothetical protein MMIC_P0359 [Mariprofundus micogutta]|uniref:DUF2802 domain-containing protein n=1 Tax=Mariprofundus micogutta TaxID=1921010 RepID=A0A1L8CKL0_9PROT|nr:hypothetical protein [Mariprofundus micogutta]GAV19425.1 hypothetical protein MMIC_P0359 [Mariprofundus micogutta]
MEALTLFLDQWLSLVIDVVLIIGVFFLWLTWYRNGRRQQYLEQLLASTAQQLDEATQHLNQATQLISQVQQKEEQRLESKAEPVQAKPRAVETTRPEPPVKKQAEATKNAPPENSSQATMILRMKREGETPEAIADRLDLPLAQVKLVLKMYAPSSKSAA